MQWTWTVHEVSTVSEVVLLIDILTVATGTANSSLSSDGQVVLQSLPATEIVRITVQLLIGARDYIVHGSESITNVCQVISQTTGIPRDQLRLTYRGMSIT